MRYAVIGRVAAALAICWSIRTPRVASAECGALDPWPDFESTIRSANRVIVGKVVDDRDPTSSQYLSVFGLRLDQVLRGEGSPGDVIEISYLRSGLPSKVCSDSHLWVLPGDEIALALDARGPGGVTAVNSVAWVSGTPDIMQSGVRRMSLEAIRDLVALPMTDTRPARNAPAATALSWGPLFPGVVLVSSLTTVLLLIQRRHNRDRPSRP